MRGFVKSVIIIHQNWTEYMYVALVLKDTMTHILLKPPHFSEELVYVIKYYYLCILILRS